MFRELFHAVMSLVAMGAFVAFVAAAGAIVS